MLCDDPRKLVELVVDNFIWGNISFIDKPASDQVVVYLEGISKEIAIFIYYRLKKQEVPPSVINGIYSKFLTLRLAKRITGELQDREQEKKIEILEKSNQELAELVKNAYIPSKDNKVGTI